MEEIRGTSIMEAGENKREKNFHRITWRECFLGLRDFRLLLRFSCVGVYALLGRYAAT